jgi:RND family efflux transporter MFP subunit
MPEPLQPLVRNNRRLKRAGLIAIAIVVVVVAAGTTTRLFARQELKNWTAEQATPTVSVLHPSKDGATRALSLPGTVDAWSEAPVFARTNGYLKAWYADIGAQVKAGQVLAEIDTPDVDQQVAAANANLATAKAQLNLAERTARRWQKLVAQDVVSKQNAEEKQNDYAVRRAMASAAEAEVERLRTLQDFRRIVAPFDGVVTSRSTDVGALIVSGNAAARPLFTVADIRKMRVYVRVPQSYVADIVPGMTAKLSVPEYSGRTFEAKLVSTSQAVNDASGSMLVQLVVDNEREELKPGSYAQVAFVLPSPPSSVRIPASALLFRSEGTSVALVDGGGRVTIRPITIAQDYGAEVAVASGLSVNDLVVDSPPDSLASGDRVRLLQNKAQGSAARS